MHRHEIAFAKQSALATNDWDIYQRIIRTCLNSNRVSSATAPTPCTGKNTQSTTESGRQAVKESR